MAMSWWSHFTCLPLYLFRHHLMRRQFHLEGSLPNVIVAMGPEQRIPDREDQSLSLLSHKRPLSDGHNHEGTQWACHKSVLAKHSSYFAAMFDSEFSESRATIVFLPRGMFTLGALDTIMHSMYADELQADTPQLLGDIYFAADYLGMPVLCRNVADRLETLAHHFTCYCETCQDNVPHILDVCRTHGQSQQGDQNMLLLAQAAIKIMTHDPDRTLQTYYTSPSLAEQLSDLPQVQHHLQEKILSRINKSNAIESLYACFVGINTLDAVDRTKDWSAPLHTTLEAVHAMTTQMIATHFRFYCSQYPSLLSCVDGISYTPEFLAYLFTEILSQDMEGDKVITFYTGIVRHLMCRHAVQHCERVRTILQAAKETVVNHIAAHVDTLREEHVFDTLNKDLLETLAQDLALLPKDLVPMDPELPKHTFFTKPTQPPPVKRKSVQEQEHKKHLEKFKLFLKQVFTAPCPLKRTRPMETKSKSVLKTPPSPNTLEKGTGEIKSIVVKKISTTTPFYQ